MGPQAAFNACSVIAVAVTLTFVVLLLAVLVAGLLRSHADILRALHSLGAGIGDPADDVSQHGVDTTRPVPIRMGPSLPHERTSSAAPDIAGTTVHEDAIAVSTTSANHTLLAFLSSGCATCAGFWDALRSPGDLGLPGDVRVVVVAKGPELEDVAVLRRLAPSAVDMVLSTQAWVDYEVPAAPFFALVDGASGRRVGEGLANTMAQVVELVRRAMDDRTIVRAAVSIDGPAREADNDELLRAAGILPGDPSLYPGATGNGSRRS